MARLGTRMGAAIDARRSGHGAVGGLIRAIDRYRRGRVEHYALTVAGRGLFLAVFLLMAFLLILDRVTNTMTGVNEIIIPTAEVPLDVDLGAVVRGAFSRTSAAVLSVFGVVAFAISAVVTARALLTGAHQILSPAQPAVVALRWRSTVGVALLVSVTVLLTWVLALGTALRTQALVAFTGLSLSAASIAVIKFVLIAITIAIVAVVTHVAARRISACPLPRSTWVPCAALGAAIVALNLFFLYTNVGALLNPNVSVGIVMILTLLTWVNLATRATLLALCSIDEARSGLPDGPPQPGHHRDWRG